MSEVINIKARGLFTHPNDLSPLPEGALSVANNVVIDKENKLAPRRGFETHSTLASSSDRLDKIFEYQDSLIAHSIDDEVLYYSSGWNALSGTYSPPSGYKLKTVLANSNLYFTTDEGVKKMDVYTSTPTFIGAPQGLDGEASLTGSSGFMADDTQVAYRIVWGYRDNNNNLILGAPSQRITIANSAGASRDVSLTFTIPSGVTVSWFYQVYRSNLSASAATEASDELGLVYEANPISGEISSKSVTITDNTPTSLRGADLYSNESQEGILQSNHQPPLSRDVASFKGYLFFANTTSRNRLYLDLVSASTLANDDVLTIAGVTYTAKATENVSSRHFLLATGGTPAQNIADTALSLVKVINQNSSNTTVYAYYLSGSDDLPGKIVIEERNVGGSSFTASASANGEAFSPSLETTQTSTNERMKNGLFWSKYQEPEAVPILNFRKVGSDDDEILRITPLRDSLFIFKESGIYRLSGESESSFYVDLFDSSTRLLASESVGVLNNQIWCFTDQGIVAVSESGVEVKSRAIETTLLELLGSNPTNMKSESFGLCYESDRKYIFSTVSTASDTYPTQMFVYNIFTDSWTRWDLKKKAGVIFGDKIIFSDSDSDQVRVERKSYNFTDFVDESLSVTISGSSGSLVTLSSTTGISIGDILKHSSSEYSPIIAINSSTEVEVVDAITWTSGSAQVLKSFECMIEFWPITGQNPGLLKQFQECILLFNKGYFTTAKARFYSDVSGSIDEVSFKGNYGSAWGLFNWGEVPWGGDSLKSFPKRLYVPRKKQRASQLSLQFKIQAGYGEFELQGVHITLRAISGRVG